MNTAEPRLSGRERSEQIAAWILVGSFLVNTIRLPGTIIELPARLVETIALGLLVATDVMSRRVRLLPALAKSGAFVPAYVLLVLSIVYPLLQQTGPDGDVTRFVGGGLGYALSYGAVAVYCGLYFNSGRLLDAFWTLSCAALVVAFAGFAIAVVRTEEILVNYRLGQTFRLQGLMSEPSAWGPIVALMIIEARRRRAYRWLAAVLVALVLTRSPTVILVAAITIPLYYLITDRRGDRRANLLLAGAVLIPVSVWYLGATDPGTLLASPNPFVKTIGRLMAGVQGHAADSEFATNRLESTRFIWDGVWRSGDGLFGNGPGASNAFFDFTIVGELSGRTIQVRANNIWIEIFFNFGMVGLVVLAIVLLLAVRRMSADRDASLALLPFIVAALINSASGVQAYQFVAVAIFVFAFGIRPRRVRAGVIDPTEDTPAAATAQAAVGPGPPEG